MNGITPDQLMTTVVVVLAIFAAIITIDKVIDIVKKWRSPGTDIMKKLAADKQRLDEHEQEITELQGSMQVLCEGVLALLDHELHNGNTDQMQKASDDILNHLRGKIGK